MNSSISLSELKNKYYIFYYYEGKPKLLKKDSEGQLMSSLDRLKNKGIDAYLAVDLFSLEVISYNYKELSIEESLREPYMIIVKTNDSVIFHNIDNRPYYDEPVLLSCGSFILINRKEKKAFIQIITTDSSYYVNYKFEDFSFHIN